MNGILIDAFRQTIFPIMVELGGILAVMGLCKAGYAIFRNANFEQFITRFKSILIAYAVIKGAFGILTFMNRIIEQVTSKL